MPDYNKDQLYGAPPQLTAEMLGVVVAPDSVTIAPSKAFTPTMQNGPKGNPSAVSIRFVRLSDQATVYGPTNDGIVELVLGSGLYACLNVISPSSQGQYAIVWDDGSGDFGAQDMFVTNQPAAPLPSGDDETQPCQLWLTGADILASCVAAQQANVSGTTLDTFAAVASELLYRLSGRQFPGVCTKNVRPCNLGCSCDWRILAWQNATSPGYGSLGPWGWGNGYWNGSGKSCGCGVLSRVRLPGYPVRDITQVSLDGAVVDPQKYRLDNRRYLTAIRGTSWPSCQDMSLPDEAGTGVFLVTYEWGAPPPILGVQAALELGCQLGMALLNPDACDLPIGTVQVQRQGVSINRSMLSAFIAGEATGLPNTDAFLAAYNPHRLNRRSAVWTPDGQPFSRPTGT